ncbi:MAG: polysaccharide biosynthesis protein [Clostridia bacterium]|nr:polysaccharide biosynthesis protein [Clostridia bacterium]
MKNIKSFNKNLWKEKAFIIAFFDLLFMAASYLFALFLRFDFAFSKIPQVCIKGYYILIPSFAVVMLGIFYICRLYHSIWRLFGVAEVMAVFKAFLLLLPFQALIILLLAPDGMPFSFYVMGYVLHFCLTVGMRASFRILRDWLNRRTSGNENKYMVIGAGATGQMLLRELQSSQEFIADSRICCVIDDNPNKKGRVIEGIQIVGNRSDIEEAVKKYEITHIVYAIPSLDLAERTAILEICKRTGCHLQTVPGMYQLVSGETKISQLRDVNILDLLGRDPVKVDNDEILEDIAGKVVLVTGGGGSIGSELCRQIAQAIPKLLIIFDIYENNAYAIQQELKRSYPHLRLEVLIGSVRNTERIETVMKIYRPDIVFHAAAHKHVPLMEDSPNEAIKNNVMGTYKTAVAAAKYGVKKFILISTDKAVNPTNIMGASKRICEMVVQMMDRQSADTSFVAVRFGNVLGSNGSVLPLFRKQIAEGGPVTVTDKRIIRYFMTIPEAVSLVLQASYYAKGGEIFVLDMGDPVKIDDMARNLIRLSGFKPDIDIKIVYTGLRPGEKLYEEILMDEEGLETTDNHLIHIGKPIEMDDEWFKKKLVELDTVSKKESSRIKELVSEIVPTYQFKPKKYSTQEFNKIGV